MLHKRSFRSAAIADHIAPSDNQRSVRMPIALGKLARGTTKRDPGPRRREQPRQMIENLSLAPWPFPRRLPHAASIADG